MKRVLFLLVAAIAVCPLYAQVIVNSDGTHSTVHGNVIVNPDGSHSTRHGNVIVNPNGSHSPMHGNVIINSDGSHSIMHGHGRNRTFVGKGSSHNTVVINIGGASITFDNQKSYKKIRRLVKKEIRRINRHMRRR